MNNHQKIPVTIITGFLGAGKTTFINRLLEENKETRFALAENEFGDVSIDSELLRGINTSTLFELKQGCICCTISDEFEQVLLELADRFPEVEHLLIETTGLADPAQVIRPFFRNVEIKNRFDIKKTICLVDALNFENSPEINLVYKQVAMADFLIVSKAEMNPEEKKKGLLNKLKKINPLAKTGFSFETNPDSNFLNSNNSDRTEHYFQNISTTGAGSISSRSVFFEKPLKKNEFLRQLEYFLDLHKKQIYRTKGILCFENEPYRYILQGVGGSLKIEEDDLILEKRNSVIVFIGNLEGLDFFPIFEDTQF